MAKKKWQNPFKFFIQPRFLSFGVLLLLKALVDFNDDFNVFILRVVCSVIAGIFLSVEIFIYYRLKFSQSQRENTVFVKQSQLHPDDFGIETSKKEAKFEVTWAYYDSVRWYEQMRKVVITGTIGLAAHLYFQGQISSNFLFGFDESFNFDL